MANESTDVLMTFILESGSGLPAECASRWYGSDSMATDFTPGDFFEIEDFSFGGGLETVDGSAGDNSWTGSNGSERGNELSKRDDPGKQGKDGDRNGKGRDGGRSRAPQGGRGTKFSKYIIERADPKKYLKLDVPEISVSRQMDKCSPYLFASCMTMEPFQKAIMVKRKIVGGLAAKDGTGQMMGYLRFEFKEPLITSIDWEDGDMVKEKFKFVCRGITMIYKPQKPDGSLGDQVSITWDATARDQTGGSSSASNSSSPSKSSSMS